METEFSVHELLAYGTLVEFLFRTRQRWHLDNGYVRMGDHCPLTAYAGNPQFRDAAAFPGAAIFCGIDVKERLHIVCAADGTWMDDERGVRSALRKAFLWAIGREEEPA